MAWQRVVAGVDASPAGVWAARYAWRVAGSVGARCHLVHAAREFSGVHETLDPDMDLQAMLYQMTIAARREVEQGLRDCLPPIAVGQLEVFMGKPAWILPREVRRRDADVLILGGKHHSRLGRWMGGSVAHYAARRVEVPTLVAIPPQTTIERILVAIDLSAAATPTLQSAIALARMFDAALTAVHVVEPFPKTYPIQLPEPAGRRRDAEERFHALVDAEERNGWIRRVVRGGHAVEILADEADAGQADLLVAGTHGKGFVDRLILGSTTYRLLDRLPTSLFLVPVTEAEPSTARQRGEGARAHAVM